MAHVLAAEPLALPLLLPAHALPWFPRLALLLIMVAVIATEGRRHHQIQVQQLRREEQRHRLVEIGAPVVAPAGDLLGVASVLADQEGQMQPVAHSGLHLVVSEMALVGEQLPVAPFQLQQVARSLPVPRMSLTKAVLFRGIDLLAHTLLA